MPTTSVTTFSIGTDPDGQPHVFAAELSPRPSRFGAALSVVLGLLMLGLALILLIPVALIAIFLVAVWLVWALVIGTLSRLGRGSTSAGRRNVRVITPRRDV